MEKKQTAVEWLVKIYLQTNKIDSFDIEQARAMEKEQIIDAAERWKGTNFAEQYYNETYQSNG